MKKSVLAMLAVAVLAAAGGYFTARLVGTDSTGTFNRTPAQPDSIEGRRRPDFSHRDLDGRMVSPGDFEGQLLLINFWASWCAPCVEEMPMLSQLQAVYSGRGLKVLGIALDDPGRAADFAAGMELGYTVLVGEADVVVTGRRYGNVSGLLPYSVMVDTEGIVRWSHLGALDRETVEKQVQDALPIK